MQQRDYNLHMNFLYDLSGALKFNTDPEKIISSIKNIYLKYINLNVLKIYLYDSYSNKFKDFQKDWISLDKIIENKLCNLLTVFENNTSSLMLNNELVFFEQLKIVNEKNEIYLPFKRSNSVFGIVHLEFCSLNNDFFNDAFAKTFEISINQISSCVLNYCLNQQMQINVNFYNSMKNIAKIIENQYELNYIIPIIGEMIDRFVSNHLIYVYLKNKEGDFELVWPGKCSDKNIYKLLEKINSKKDYILSCDKKTAVFPLSNEKEILGAIIAISPNFCITKKDIDYLTQLTKQSSTTIHRANLYSEILKHATLDALTGLNNRRQLEIRLSQEVATAKRKNKKLCCIFLDLDYFKNINDKYGHFAGDCVLKEVSKIIESQLREYDIASRYGGEEFCILLPYTSVNEATFVASRLRKKVQDHKFEIVDDNGHNKIINVTISIGLSSYDQNTINKPEDLYKNADKALYTAKENGRNRIEIFQTGV